MRSSISQSLLPVTQLLAVGQNAMVISSGFLPTRLKSASAIESLVIPWEQRRSFIKYRLKDRFFYSPTFLQLLGIAGLNGFGFGFFFGFGIRSSVSCSSFFTTAFLGGFPCMNFFFSSRIWGVDVGMGVLVCSFFGVGWASLSCFSLRYAASLFFEKLRCARLLIRRNWSLAGP